MKPTSNKMSKKNGYQSDDDNVKYKINTEYFNNVEKAQVKTTKRLSGKIKSDADDDDVRYKFPALVKSKPADRKSKPKIKVNFWSTKHSTRRVHNSDNNKDKSTNRRHTVAVIDNAFSNKPKTSTVKVRKRVSFLPSPVFSDNHIPMVTVPDDLTIQLNEEEANDLGEDLNQAFVNIVNSSNVTTNEPPKRKSRTSTTQTSPKGTKRKRSIEDSEYRVEGHEHELEFFSKYVVQKLRRMETNQRIYSENLINTVLMLGQLGKLNGKSKITDA